MHDIQNIIDAKPHAPAFTAPTQKHSQHTCSIKRYAASNVEFVIKVATAYAWLTAMCVIVLVPVDVWSTYAGKDSMRGTISVFWNTAYW